MKTGKSVAGFRKSVYNETMDLRGAESPVEICCPLLEKGILMKQMSGGSSIRRMGMKNRLKKIAVIGLSACLALR